MVNNSIYAYREKKGKSALFFVLAMFFMAGALLMANIWLKPIIAKGSGNGGLLVGMNEVDAPTIVSDLPSNMSVRQYDKLTLQIEAQGDGLTYQWYKVEDLNSSTATLIAGANKDSYDVATEKEVDIKYYVVVTSRIGDDRNYNTSNKTIVSVKSDDYNNNDVAISNVSDISKEVEIATAVTLQISTNSANDSVEIGDIEWYKSNKSSYTDAVKIADASGETLDLTETDTQVAGTMYYFARVNYILDGKDFYNESDIFTVTTTADSNYDITIRNIPKPEYIVPVGEYTQLEVDAYVKTGSLSYQWYITNNANDTTNGEKITIDGTLKEYQVRGEVKGTKYYYAIVENNANGKYKRTTYMYKVTTVPVAEFIRIKTPPESKEVGVGEDFILTVSASTDGGSMLEYQWYQTDEKNEQVVKLNAETGSTLSLNIDADGTFYYYVEITNRGKGDEQAYSINSDIAKIKVGTGLGTGTNSGGFLQDNMLPLASLGFGVLGMAGCFILILKKKKANAPVSYGRGYGKR